MEIWCDLRNHTTLDFDQEDFDLFYQMTHHLVFTQKVII